MKLRGKRVERLNTYGDDLCITLQGKGKMRLSPVLISKLQLNKDFNKIGFGYPENSNEDVVIYRAEDNDGVAVNRQGYLTNIPHVRDLRSYLKLEEKIPVELHVSDIYTSIDEYPGYRFFKVYTTSTSPLPQEEDIVEAVEEDKVEHVDAEVLEELPNPDVKDTDGEQEWF
jgi:hypothetical protein|tara:strand:- start:1477 stop:1989 length:513 start_codon:yes stop_codon:yes gene_type:complete